MYSNKLLYIIAVALVIWVFLIDPNITYTIHKEPVTIREVIKDNNSFWVTIETDDSKSLVIETTDEQLTEEKFVYLIVDNHNTYAIEKE